MKPHTRADTKWPSNAKPPPWNSLHITPQGLEVGRKEREKEREAILHFTCRYMTLFSSTTNALQNTITFSKVELIQLRLSECHQSTQWSTLPFNYARSKVSSPLMSHTWQLQNKSSCSVSLWAYEPRTPPNESVGGNKSKRGNYSELLHWLDFQNAN